MWWKWASIPIQSLLNVTSLLFMRNSWDKRSHWLIRERETALCNRKDTWLLASTRAAPIKVCRLVLLWMHSPHVQRAKSQKRPASPRPSIPGTRWHGFRGDARGGRSAEAFHSVTPASVWFDSYHLYIKYMSQIKSVLLLIAEKSPITYENTS